MLRGAEQEDLDQLRAEATRLQAELANQQQESLAKEQQLEVYAADLRETFKQERSRREELQQSYMATVRALSNAVEARDAYTAKHAERVAAYGLTLARQMQLPLADDTATEFGFLLHDVGKVAISDRILHKPGPLTAEERTDMERHPVVGAAIISEIDFLAGAAGDVVRHHHEKWNGTGYPDRLAGEQIPLAARVFAVADVFDALTTDRPYRRGMPFSKARALIVGDSGSHFDPAVVAAFEQISDQSFEQIAEEIG